MPARSPLPARCLFARCCVGLCSAHGLKQSVQKAGLEWEGRLHSGLDDARSAFPFLPLPTGVLLLLHLSIVLACCICHQHAFAQLRHESVNIKQGVGETCDLLRSMGAAIQRGWQQKSSGKER